ncbi:2OG-Fe(II) oxygenase family oxidoreductase [Colletotrichum eremochloae]|nr:2OG-Fe(II) oxygenase family oxidoreductase [Colletotrichum eremochloae]
MDSARFEGPSQGDTANLSVISMQKLLSEDAEEASKLFSACSEWGFFCLDLGSDEIEPYRATAGRLDDSAVQYFNKPLEEKMQDTNHVWETFNICGYKPRSLDTGNREGKKDGCEGLRLPADAILLSRTHLRFPRGAEMHRDLVGNFIEQSHAIATLVLSRLSTSLGLKGTSRLEDLDRAGQPSTSTAIIQHYPFEGDLPAEMSSGHFAHTDTGSVTILFNTEWGLQVCSPHSEEWQYVPPARGTHAIVNIGDTIKSCLHRVVPYFDRWTRGSRYAIIFFLRANNQVEFEDLEGQKWNAYDWLNKKFLNYRSPHEVQKQSPMATGRLGFVGLWKPGMSA